MLLFSSATIARAQVTNLAPGQTINLATVINSNLTLQIADKQFGNFAFDWVGGALNLYSSNLVITALSNAVGFGVQFTQPLTLVGQGTDDFTLEYSALVTAPGYYIDDIDLAITGSASGGGVGSVGETVYSGGFGTNQVGELEAFTPNAGPEQATNNIVPPQTEIWVEKDVVVACSTNNPFAIASISIIDQTYSEIPEPSTALLVGVGVLGVVAVNRRRKS